MFVNDRLQEHCLADVPLAYEPLLIENAKLEEIASREVVASALALTRSLQRLRTS